MPIPPIEAHRVQKEQVIVNDVQPSVCLRLEYSNILLGAYFYPDAFWKIQPVIFKQLDTFILVVCHGAIRIIYIFYTKVVSVLEICTTFMTDVFCVIRHRLELVSRIFQRQIINKSKGTVVFFPCRFNWLMLPFRS